MLYSSKQETTPGKKILSLCLAIALLIVMAQTFVTAGATSSADITYTNYNLGFSLKLPASWAGKYRVVEFSVATAFHNIRNENAGYGGFLFDIMVSDTTEATEWGYRLLTKSGNLYYLAGFPSDVQFDYTNAALTAEYNAMEKDIDAILKTFTLISSSTQENEIKVFVNGKAVVFDQPPIAENGRTLVPMRAIFEALGASVAWEQSTQTVTAKRGDITISLQIGSNILVKNGVRIELDVPAKAVGGRTLVPVRAISESLGSSVKWDQNTRTVTITDSY